MIDLELKAAIEDVKMAEANFNNATNDSVKIAIYELIGAEERLNSILEDRKSRKEH